MTELSIIIPVYNVEDYIRLCLESIFRQGLDETCFEVIIVNDGTKDRSMEMIADIISNHRNITVINQENQGLSIARNNGIAKSKGEYILMPDPDDFLIERSLLPLLKKALEMKADLIVADFLTTNNTDSIDYKSFNQNDIQFQEKSGEQLFLDDLNPRQCYVWRTLYRREFILENHICFIPGMFYQDVPFTHECYLKAKLCLKTSWKLYVYRIRRYGAATASFNQKKAKDFCIAIEKIWDLSNSVGVSPEIKIKLQNNAFATFSILMYSLPLISSPEQIMIIKYLREIMPGLSFQNSTKQKIVTFLYSKIPLTYIFMRSIYGKVFEDFFRPLFRHHIYK